MNAKELFECENLVKELEVHVDHLNERGIHGTFSTRWYLTQCEIAIKKLLKEVKNANK